jgi:hypothetical protein
MHQEDSHTTPRRQMLEVHGISPAEGVFRDLTEGE